MKLRYKTNPDGTLEWDSIEIELDEEEDWNVDEHVVAVLSKWFEVWANFFPLLEYDDESKAISEIERVFNKLNELEDYRLAYVALLVDAGPLDLFEDYIDFAEDGINDVYVTEDEEELLDKENARFSYAFQCYVECSDPNIFNKKEIAQ